MTIEECGVCDDDGFTTVNSTEVLNVQPGALNYSSSVYTLTNGKKAIIRIEEKPHPVFTRDNKDLFMLISITKNEAVNGTQKEVRMVDGEIETITIPGGIKNGEFIILENKGFIWDENSLLKRIVSRYEAIRGKLHIRLLVSQEQGDMATLYPASAKKGSY